MNIDTQLQNESKQSIIKKFALGVGAFFLCASALIGLGAIALSSHQSNVVKTSALDINEYDGNIYYDENTLSQNFYLGFDFSSLTSNDLQDTYCFYDGNIESFVELGEHYIVYDEGYEFFIDDSYWEIESLEYWHFPQLASYLNSAKTTLTPSELNNNSYSYLADYLNGLSSFDGYVIYNNVYYYVEEFSTHDGIYFNDGFGYSIAFYLEDDTYKFYYYDPIFDTNIPFSSNLEIYSFDIKQNMYAPNNPTGLLETLVALLTGGITGFASGFGTGVSGLVNAIFVTDGHLSVFAAAIIIFAGISLAIGLCRWVMNFLTSIGAKK